MTPPARKLTHLIAKYPYAAQHSAVCTLACAAVLISVTEMVIPEHLLLAETSLGHEFPKTAEYLWAGLGCIGGSLAVVGIVRQSRPLETCGFAALGSVWALDAYAVFAYRGYAAGSITGAILAALSLAYFTRVVVLLWVGQTQRDILSDLADVATIERELHDDAKDLT